MGVTLLLVSISNFGYTGLNGWMWCHMGAMLGRGGCACGPKIGGMHALRFVLFCSRRYNTVVGSVVLVPVYVLVVFVV